MYFNSCVNGTWHLEVALEVQTGRGHSAPLCVADRMTCAHAPNHNRQRSFLFIPVRQRCRDHLVYLFLSLLLTCPNSRLTHTYQAFVRCLSFFPLNKALGIGLELSNYKFLIPDRQEFTFSGL